ncbi:MAG: 1-deoxy-D-xylulose-5-phosphate reductoisomerase [Bacteroidia bacterium]|nr:1-deoxy-D-xylulose-5-phosphate reductoisomerase [Bacteroidia bacterium]
MKHGKIHSIAVFGATGSIGQSTLEVARRHPDIFDVRYLSGNRNVPLLCEMVRAFRPAATAVVDAVAYREVQANVGHLTEVLGGEEALVELAARTDYDIMVSSLVGSAGLLPTVTAIQGGKRIALANKETLVVAGEYITALTRAHGVDLLPIDSEHSAIMQCIVGEPAHSVSRIILTASGGPFRGWEAGQLDAVTPAQALRHPNWSMGNKITIDSATLMNKGLEVIEAHWLFGKQVSDISVVVHPQSIIHSLVEFSDGSVKAQLGVPDMKLPILYALTYPERIPSTHERLDLAAIGSLTFEQPDTDSFPCLRLAYEALDRGGTAPAILNAANEVAVAAFLAGTLNFRGIPAVIEECLGLLPISGAERLDDILAADTRARETASRIIASHRAFQTAR